MSGCISREDGVAPGSGGAPTPAQLNAPIAEYEVDFSLLANETLTDTQVDDPGGLGLDWTVQVALGDDLAYVLGTGLRASITNVTTTFDGNGNTCSWMRTPYSTLYAALSLSSGITIDSRAKIQLTVQYASPPTSGANQIVGIADRGTLALPLSSSARCKAAGYEHDGTRQNVMVISDTARDRMYPYDSNDTAVLDLGVGNTNAHFGIWNTTLDDTAMNATMSALYVLTTEPIKEPTGNFAYIFFRGTTSGAYVADVERVIIRAYP